MIMRFLSIIKTIIGLDSDAPSSLRVFHQSRVLDTMEMTEVSAITSSLRAPEVRSNPESKLDCRASLTLARNDGGASSGLSLEASLSFAEASRKITGLLCTFGARNDEGVLKNVLSSNNNTRKQLSILCLLLLLLTACQKSGHTPHYFQLIFDDTCAVALPHKVVINQVITPQHLRGQKIYFKPNPLKTDFFADHFWVDPLPQMMLTRFNHKLSFCKARIAETKIFNWELTSFYMEQTAPDTYIIQASGRFINYQEETSPLFHYQSAPIKGTMLEYIEAFDRGWRNIMEQGILWLNQPNQ